MSRLVNTDLLVPQVQLAPSANPIQTNILPAPGQELRGNTLQQIAESLSVFNAGLSNFSSTLFARDVRRVEEAASSIDFTEVLQRGDLLNKNFQQILQEMDLPDAANPFFQIAAEKTFALGLYAKAENNVLLRRDELTDPGLSVEQRSQGLRRAFDEEIANLGGDRLRNNFYANQMLNERRAQRFDAVQQDFDRTYLSRMEGQAYLDFTTGMTEILAGSRSGIIEEDFAERVGEFVSMLQKTSTDPIKFRSAFLDAARLAMTGATTVQELDNIRSAILATPYGTAAVSDNIALTLEVAEEHRRASKALESKIDNDQRAFQQAVNAEERRLRGEGHFDRVITAAMNREDYFSVIEGIIEGVEDPAIASVIREQLNQIATTASSQERSARGVNTRQALLRGDEMIRRGELRSEVEILAFADAMGMDQSQIKALLRVHEQIQSIETTQQNQANSFAQSLASALEREAATRGSTFNQVDKFIEFREELSSTLIDFFAGNSFLDGKDYNQFRSQGMNEARAAATEILQRKIAEIRSRESAGFEIEEQRASIAPETPPVTTGVANFHNATNPKKQREALLALAKGYGDEMAQLYQSMGMEILGRHRRAADPARLARLLASSLTLSPDQGSLSFLYRDPERGLEGGDRFSATVTVERDGETFVVQRRNMFGNLTETGRFDSSQVAAFALKTRMSPFGGFSVEQVIANESGVPGFSFEDAARRTSVDGRFRWVEVPVFSDIAEMGAFMQDDDPTRTRLLFKRTLGIENPTQQQVLDFLSAQRQAILLRNAWREYVDNP